jgi:ATP/maltotriose-dependent transcriptional regulator MalT
LIAALLARVLLELDRLEEAETTFRVAAELAASDDIETQAIVRSVNALILSTRGAHGEAERLGREGLELVRRADAPVLEADVLVDLSVVLARARLAGEASIALDDARRLYERKEHLVGAERARAALAAEGAATGV